LIDKLLRDFREIWVVDTEFRADQGERPEPHCLVGHEFRTGRTLRLWGDDLRRSPQPPFSLGEDSIYIAYYTSAELGCHLALGWPMPQRILDLFAEFRCLTNGLPTPLGSGLLGALAYFGLDTIAAVEKQEMRELAMRGGPYNLLEKQSLLEYCETDVQALVKLLPRILPRIDLPRALLRGRYMAAVARMEHTGTPIDTHALRRLRSNWDPIRTQLIDKVDANFGVYREGSFSRRKWEDYLVTNTIPWPTLPSGELDLKDDTFRGMAKRYPDVAEIQELRYTLSQLTLCDLAVGLDGRNRCLLSAFRSRTGRNQPSNSKFIFGPSCWLRGLIKPPPGNALAYIDWEQQEFGIAAALSGDKAMKEAYLSGDPYLAFAKQSGAVPPNATKATHGPAREQFKQCVLGVQYAMGAASLAQRLGMPEIYGRDLLTLHRKTYPTYWDWSQAALDRAMLLGQLNTVFGWRISTSPESNSRGLRNFPMQANGAEMLRLACCLATEDGIRVCAPVHDAILIEGPAATIEEVVDRTRQHMRQASEIVLGGFPLRTEEYIVRYPDRYLDPRGSKFWAKVMDILDRLET